MVDNVRMSAEKLIKEWPSDRLTALMTSNDPKEIEAGALALREALNLCTQTVKQGRSTGKGVERITVAKARRDISEMRDAVQKMLRDQQRPAGPGNS